MSGYLTSRIFGNKGDRLTKEFSYIELSTCYGLFRGKFRDQILRPSSENNFLINYDLEVKNFMIQIGTINMLQAGLGTYAFKTFFGRPIDRHAFNYLGEKKGYLL